MSGAVKCWGSNGLGQIGDGQECGTICTTPVDVVGMGPKAASGDISCDGSVNSIDAALILQFGAGLTGLLACQASGDVNADGSVSAIDAALILQYSAGLIDSLPP